MSHFIYADHAATTAVSDTALQAMLPHFTTAYGNPSSLYRFAQEGKTDLERARAEIAACLNARPEEWIPPPWGGRSGRTPFLSPSWPPTTRSAP